MAPPKRARRQSDGGSDNEVEIQEARSSFTRASQPTKRVRVSFDKARSRSRSRAPTGIEDGDGDDEDGVSNSDDEGDDSDDSATAPGSPPQTQYELMRDNGFRHLENTDLDDQRATQKLAQRTTQLLNNMVAESGIIESVECINFMCHERLHVELGPLINFIVGENGSGKSAVLTALTLCLGGKASDTNRGGSLKAFVKEGREQGTLIVKIKNAGSDAYKPDLYGNSIIVERHFSKTGASGFRIKSETGRVISVKKQDVEDISEWFALQMGNPLTVLSQDNARQFLNSATPAQKYKYFVSGVQLEQLDNDYKLAQDTLDKTLIIQDDLTERIADRKKELEEAQRLADTARKNQGLREKFRLYRNQVAWVQVVDQERELDLLKADVVKREQGLEDLQRVCEQRTQALKECEEKKARKTADRDALEAEGQAYEEKVNAAEAELNNCKQEHSTLHCSERDAFVKLKNTRDEIKSVDKKIEEEEKRLTESTGSARAQKESELQEAQSKEEEIQNQLQEANAKIPALRTALSSADEALNKAVSSRGQKYQETIAAEKAMRDLRNSTGSAYDGFDQELVNLAKAVKADSGFENKPLGPVGAYVKLRKPEWSQLLEKTLGDALNAFVVQGKRDQTRLSAMIRRMNIRRPPPIFIAYGSRIDTSSQEPDERFDTILRVLEFEDDLIRSQLIINSTIEKIILVKDRRQAESIMVDNEVPPRNVAACICFHDGETKRGHGFRITFRSASGSASTAPITPFKGRPRMQSDIGGQIVVQEENLRMLRSELNDLKDAEARLKESKERCASELDQNKKRIPRLQNDLRRVQADVEQISQELDAFEGVDSRLNLLKEQRAKSVKDEETLGMQYGDMHIKKAELAAEVDQAKQKLNAERLEQKEYNSRMTKAEEKVKSCESLRKIAQAEKNAVFETMDIDQDKLRRAVARRDKKEEEIAEFIRLAKEVAPDRVHIPENESYESISRKYKKLADQIHQRERRAGATDEEIFNRATEKAMAYDQHLARARDVDKTINDLKGALELRLHLWRQFQRQISARIRIQFNYLLSERGFRGKIDLDHRARNINIQIEPDQTRKSAAGRNTKTLSGGEKSFASICMLLSIWEAIGSPIRCLDEFDVFMDNVNRAVSTNMLVDAARRSVSRQYILITPNAIQGNVNLDKDVKIIR
ncbi:Structural maintenance of chromosomes protein 6 [Escovopsis weberi]|uniref:Structural maintenance of chromosomes protein 6 n=1 Tax=Escovopsis weberi TaxID=150374 RepID=A0A0M8MSN9_ESCWE|nr:Structural maintenance of chromosomes protein 6 [Escovopsis weberi]